MLLPGVYWKKKTDVPDYRYPTKIGKSITLSTKLRGQVELKQKVRLPNLVHFLSKNGELCPNCAQAARKGTLLAALRRGLNLFRRRCYTCQRPSGSCVQPPSSPPFRAHLIEPCCEPSSAENHETALYQFQLNDKHFPRSN